MWKRSARTFLHEPNFVDTNIISPTGVGMALISGLDVELSLAPFHCCNPWLNTLQQYPHQRIYIILATIHLIIDRSLSYILVSACVNSKAGPFLSRLDYTITSREHIYKQQ